MKHYGIVRRLWVAVRPKRGHWVEGKVRVSAGGRGDVKPDTNTYICWELMWYTSILVPYVHAHCSHYCKLFLTHLQQVHQFTICCNFIYRHSLNISMIAYNANCKKNSIFIILRMLLLIQSILAKYKIVWDKIDFTENH